MLASPITREMWPSKDIPGEQERASIMLTSSWQHLRAVPRVRGLGNSVLTMNTPLLTGLLTQFVTCRQSKLQTRCAVLWILTTTPKRSSRWDCHLRHSYWPDLTNSTGASNRFDMNYAKCFFRTRDVLAKWNVVTWPPPVLP